MTYDNQADYRAFERLQDEREFAEFERTVMDLGKHAATEALNTIRRVADLAGTDLEKGAIIGHAGALLVAGIARSYFIQGKLWNDNTGEDYVRMVMASIKMAKDMPFDVRSFDKA